MKRRTGFQVAYATNVHPGEGLSEVLRSLEDTTVAVNRRVFGPGPSGLELRVGIALARELSRPEAFERLRGFLADEGLVLFSVNAFPLLDFHARRVKEKAYRPSWAEPGRCRWTKAIARIFAGLLPEGVEGTLSTLAGALRSGREAPDRLERIAAGYVDALGELARIEAETGKTIVLAVEPEPGTTFETAREVVRFFESALSSEAVRAWRPAGLSRSECERRLRRFFTVNFDACHFSVLFEDLRESFRELRAAGLRVSKVHVTSALSLEAPHRSPAGYSRFRGMREPRYAHQFAGRDRLGRVTWRGADLDLLPPRLLPTMHPEVVELRCHYHVPLYRKDWGGLGTTREETRELVRAAAREGTCRQFVVETYTWPLLEGEVSRLADRIARELRWLLRILPETGPSSP